MRSAQFTRIELSAKFTSIAYNKFRNMLILSRNSASIVSGICPDIRCRKVQDCLPSSSRVTLCEVVLSSISGSDDLLPLLLFLSFSIYSDDGFQ
jgi:hypothetical protein